jgi:hypothetical protein
MPDHGQIQIQKWFGGPSGSRAKGPDLMVWHVLLQNVPNDGPFGIAHVQQGFGGHGFCLLRSFASRCCASAKESGMPETFSTPIFVPASQMRIGRSPSFSCHTQV